MVSLFLECKKLSISFCFVCWWWSKAGESIAFCYKNNRDWFFVGSWHKWRHDKTLNLDILLRKFLSVDTEVIKDLFASFLNAVTERSYKPYKKSFYCWFILFLCFFQHQPRNNNFTATTSWFYYQNSVELNFEVFISQIHFSESHCHYYWQIKTSKKWISLLFRAKRPINSFSYAANLNRSMSCYFQRNNLDFGRCSTLEKTKMSALI